MNTRLFIPKKCKVGSQNRSNTYTGKLGYVIYQDDRGKWRKVTSWENWRDKSINPVEFDNVPTEGFVLNRSVGGVRQSWGWNTRSEYVRVFDPRGFEFEISVPNLLFILEECDSIKGKGLTGQFVYSYMGKDLVLLPVHSQEYTESTAYNKRQSGKVYAKDVKENHYYLTKDETQVIYMGKMHFEGLYYGAHSWNYDIVAKNVHVVYDLKAEQFRAVKSIPALLKQDLGQHPDALTHADTLQNSYHVNKFQSIEADHVGTFKVIRNDRYSRYSSNSLKVSPECTGSYLLHEGMYRRVGNWSYYGRVSFNGIAVDEALTEMRFGKRIKEDLNLTDANGLPMYRIYINDHTGKRVTLEKYVELLTNQKTDG